MKTFLALAILLVGFTFASAQHEYAPLQEKEIKYKNWTYASVRDFNQQLNLRDFARGKKLLMVVYFAAWCPNWQLEAPFAQKLYDKYKAYGFNVVGVSEYDTIAATKTNLVDNKITFTVVAESEATEAREKTSHFEYRKASGDTRKWGSPWHIFIEPANLKGEGETLLEKAFVVNGELIEAETEKFVRQKLGLPAEEKTAGTATKEKVIETCASDKKEATLKKP